MVKAINKIETMYVRYQVVSILHSVKALQSKFHPEGLYYLLLLLLFEIGFVMNDPMCNGSILRVVLRRW